MKYWSIYLSMRKKFYNYFSRAIGNSSKQWQSVHNGSSQYKGNFPLKKEPINMVFKKSRLDYHLLLAITILLLRVPLVCEKKGERKKNCENRERCNSVKSAIFQWFFTLIVSIKKVILVTIYLYSNMPLYTNFIYFYIVYFTASYVAVWGSLHVIYVFLREKRTLKG